VPYARGRQQENQQCNGCQPRIDTQRQTNACDYLKTSSAQHEKIRQAGGSTMIHERFCSKSLADHPEASQEKYCRYQNTRKG
jgi:hypothetical protein